MAKSKKSAEGICSKRSLTVRATHTCDWYKPKKRGRYKVCCRNCAHFSSKGKKDDKPATSPLQQDRPEARD